MSKTYDIVNVLKDNQEDLEWFPTTDQIIEDLYKDIRSEVLYERNRHTSITLKSILDIGAGDGRVLNKLNEYEKDIVDEHGNDESNPFKLYAIEKSQVLIDQMDKNIIILGTDFYEQSLIDKQVDVIFNNPPFSDFSFWMEKIIKEGNAKVIYFVVPKRWEEQENIKFALKKREADYKVIGEYDFLEADRPARTKVNLIRIDLVYKNGNRYSEENYFKGDDPFTIWFDEHFHIKADKTTNINYKAYDKKLNEVTTKKDLIPHLVESYQRDFKNYLDNYKALETIDSVLLKELGVTLKSIKEGLKSKIEGLKNIYWQKLFDNLDTITDRLTTKTRKKLLEQLQKHNKIDFTFSNIYSIIIWAIKNANSYFETQLLEVYDDFSKKENITLYKSNKRIIEDGWRYNRMKAFSHYVLDYRIVNHFFEAIKSKSSWSTWDYDNNLKKGAHDQIEDIITVAKNLGFKVKTKSIDIIWEAGKKNNFYLEDGTLFAEIKGFLNGNLHYKFMPKFMKKLNVEAGRLKGWIKSPKEASEEFDVTEEEAKEFFRGNFQLDSKGSFLLE